MSTFEFSVVVSILGGEKALGIKESDGVMTLHRAIKAGIPARCAFHFQDHVGLSNINVCHMLGVTEKTLTRWHAAPRKHLDPVFSDRLVRSAKVIALAEQVLESPDNAKQWMSEPQDALAGEAPQDLLTTDIGAQQVEDLLVRMEHGFLA